MEQISTVEYQKRMTDKGYIRIFVDDRWIYEHVYIVEQFIGRELKEGEVVHHINSIKTDNRISNLMLFKNQKEHQKFHLKIKQFGYTNPICRQIANRWKEYIEVEDGFI